MRVNTCLLHVFRPIYIFCFPPLAIVTLCASFPTETWTAQATTGEKPPALQGHTLTMVDDHRAVLFGGSKDRTWYNDVTYILDMETWVRVSLWLSLPYTSCCISCTTSVACHNTLVLYRWISYTCTYAWEEGRVKVYC